MLFVFYKYLYTPRCLNAHTRHRRVFNPLYKRDRIKIDYKRKELSRRNYWAIRWPIRAEKKEELFPLTGMRDIWHSVRIKQKIMVLLKDGKAGIIDCKSLSQIIAMNDHRSNLAESNIELCSLVSIRRRRNTLSTRSSFHKACQPIFALTLAVRFVYLTDIR